MSEIPRQIPYFRKEIGPDQPLYWRMKLDFAERQIAFHTHQLKLAQDDAKMAKASLEEFK